VYSTIDAAYESVAVKRRLRKAPLTKMKVALAREQAVAEKDAGPLECLPFCEILLVRDQYIPNKIGMIQKEHLLPGHPETDDIAVSRCRPLQERERSTPQLQEHVARIPASRAGRKRHRTSKEIVAHFDS
jgi:hypothetical protein